MGLQLYNTLSRRLEEFEPLQAGRVTMYTCGPTVYNPAHIGNFRTFLCEDILRRYLEWKGYSVTQAKNLTDVDDRTIHAAVKEGIGLRELTEPYIEAFFVDSDRLGLERAEHYPRATEYVPQMIDLVEKLVDRGLAYTSEGSVYFDISKFPDYGALAQIDASNLLSSERVSGDEEYDKENARDFVLWKGGDRKEEGDVAVWESPWGPGRPGWHLECSVMAVQLLGQPFDIHTGGVDLIFPHHTNEIAQAQGATGRPFARTWLHVKHALLDGRKMSKSLNHYYTLDDLVERGYRPSAIRRLLVSGHYRTELNFTLAGLDDAARSVERMLDFRRRLAEARSQDADAVATGLPSAAERAVAEFERAMDDDLNVSEAWAALFTFIREANSELDAASQRLAPSEVDVALETLSSLDRVFGVLELADRETGMISAEFKSWVEERLAERARARERRDYARADAIRDELATEGVEIEDTPAGSRWKLAPRG